MTQAGDPFVGTMPQYFEVMGAASRVCAGLTRRCRLPPAGSQGSISTSSACSPNTSTPMARRRWTWWTLLTCTFTAAAVSRN